jgi:hypothetical protein
MGPYRMRGVIVVLRYGGPQENFLLNDVFLSDNMADRLSLSAWKRVVRDSHAGEKRIRVPQ